MMKENKPKIALLYHEYPPITSGIGSYTYDLANNLSKNGIQVIVITGAYKEKDSCTRVNNNLKVYRLKTPSIMPRFIWFQIKNKKKIKKILTKEKIDVLHGQAGSSAFLFNNSVFKGKKVLTMHGTAGRVANELLKAPFKHLKFKDVLIHLIGLPLWSFLERKEIYQSDKVIAFNIPLVNSIKKEYSTKKEIVIIPQGLDISKIKKFKEDNPHYDNSIFFAGRLIWIKGITYLLDSFKEVNKSYPELKLKIFGNGPLKEFILDFKKKNNLENNIILYNFVPLETLIKEMGKSYFGVFPSLIEAESVAMIESMACKKTIIVFDLPFIKYTLDSKNALLVKNNKKALARGIIKLIQDKNLRSKLEENAYNLIINKHEWSKITKEYIKVYKKIVE